MFSRFFIDRPIFAAVLSITVTLAGTIAVFELPLAQYPQIAPPTVNVSCSYPGASAQVVAETVAAPIEQQVNGVENMFYMSSQCANDGSYSLDVTFKHGVDLNMAQVLVQNRVNLAVPLLPDVIKQTGVTTKKRSPDIVMSVNINSPGGTYDQLYLSNYSLMHIREELVRLPGVSDVSILGQRDYSMRIWLDPDQLAVRNLTADDVVAAVMEQNAEVACGRIGMPPIQPGQASQITLSTLGRLVEPKQFADIVLRADTRGRLIRIRDVGRVALGAVNEDVSCRLDGKPSVGLAVWQLPDANALELSDRIRAKMDELAKAFPPDMVYQIQFDTTPYTRQTIEEVFKSLRDSVILVALVVLLFLQNWRSAIIPLVAVPVAIIGTFAVMAVAGFSLNNLTLFGLVLSIGIVVDDAIVVVEAIQHHVEQGLPPREATIKAMSQVSVPVVAVGLVLSAVFVPCAFIGGITGRFFQQFALTISSATILSTFNSLSLSPALAAILLRSRDRETHEPLPRLAFVVLGGWLGYALAAPWLAARLEPLLAVGPQWLRGWAGTLLPWIVVAAAAPAGWLGGRLVNRVLVWGFRGFNRGFRASIAVYLRSVRKLLRFPGPALAVYAVLLGLTCWGFRQMPKGFIPTQDMGYLLVNVQLPDSASLERTTELIDRVEKVILTPHNGVKHTLGVVGLSFLLNARAPNLGSFFVILDDFPDRLTPELYSERIATGLRKRLAQEIPDAMVTVFPAVPVRGVGRAGGFKIMVEDRGNLLGPAKLQEVSDGLVRAGNDQRAPGGKVPLLVGLFNTFRANIPSYFFDLNRSQCQAMQVPLVGVFDTLQVFLGSLYVNDFNRFGRTWQVNVQADGRFRDQSEKVMQMKVRNTQGGMVPLGAVARMQPINSPLILTRYNTYLAAGINGNAGPRTSSGDAIKLMEQLAAQKLSPSTVCEWTEMAFMELLAGNTAMYIFGFAILMVFLMLAAQYESWSLPLAVILVVPLCLSCALAGVFIARADINIFTQIGFVVLVGLASKNAILLVEFAKRQREQGASPRAAALGACRLRLRPIVMTSSAFILGVSSLLVARGAGAEMRRLLGTAVFSGMLGVTLFGIFLTPVFFIVVDRASHSRLFTARLTRLVGYVLLICLTLGIPWLFSRLPERGNGTPPPEGEGDGAPPAGPGPENQEIP
ncbi:MAG: efflux RND transporter permease subunit [Thermoguttaceae bacterium]|jgi:multidrug efflux pump